MVKALIPNPRSFTMNQIIAAFLLGVVINLAIMYNKQVSPASDWIIPESIVIPDHALGSEDEVAIEYKRQIKKDFTGKFFVEVQIATPKGFIAVQECKSSSIPYKTDKTLPKVITLNWFKGGDCKWVRRDFKTFEEGQYRLCATWEVNIPGYDPKYTDQLCSNVYYKKNPKVFEKSQLIFTK